MKKIVILGGAGGQGLHSTKEIIRGGVFDEIVVASRNIEKTDKIISKLDADNVTTQQIDVMDKDALIDLIKDADVVANCTGPFYLLGAHVVDAAIEAGVDYVDFCDDIVCHQEVFTDENQKKAEEKDISVIIGLGQSPGVMPLEAVHGATYMDEIDDMDIYMTIDSYDDADGPAVLLHVVENFVGEIEVVRDGKKYMEQPFEGLEYFDFGGPFGESLISTMGHPEVFSLPRVFPDAKNVIVKLGLWPSEDFERIRDMAQAGLAEEEPIPMINGEDISPRDFLVSNIIAGLGDDIPERPLGAPVSAWVVRLLGKKDGDRVEYKKTTYSQMGPSTGFSLAIGAEMLAKGEIKEKGMVVPEECIEDPVAFVNEVAERSKAAGFYYYAKEEITKEEHLIGDDKF